MAHRPLPPLSTGAEKLRTEDEIETASPDLSFLRRQESILINRLVDPRFRGDDKQVGCRVAISTAEALAPPPQTTKLSAVDRELQKRRRVIERYQIVIIGGGPGGYTAGIRAAIKGAKVAVIEDRELGGVCLNRGCIPSKALIASAVQYHKMKKAELFGIRLESPPAFDWQVMNSRKDRIVGQMVGGIERLFKSHGVVHYKGFGSIIDPNHVRIIDRDGNETTIETDNIIIATGSRPADVPGIKADGKSILTSDHFLELASLPESMLIVGAGVIGCEWAFMLAMLDVKVVMVEMLEHVLPLEDVDTSVLIERELKKLKVKLHTGTKVESATSTSAGLQVKLSNGETIDIEKALVSVGRAYNTKNLGLEGVGVTLNPNGSIKTGADLRTSVENIFAIGDVRGEIMLAYTATHDGSVAVDNCLGEQTDKNYRGVPSVIFTYPEVASVGLTEQAAVESHDVVIGRFPLRMLGKAHAENEIAGEVKVIGDKKTDQLLGVHIVGTHATEVIHVAALAVRQGMTMKQLGDLIFGHPVISESIMEAAHDTHDLSVHVMKKA